jgi:uncharacterized membrane protein YqjE
MPTAARPISAVLHDIIGNVQDIVRSELRLAKTEVSEELGKLGSAAVLLGVGALLVTFSAGFLLLAAVYALSLVMPGWAAALIVAVAAGAIAALCCGLGIKRVKAVRAAPKTAASMKENAEWAKQLTK